MKTIEELIPDIYELVVKGIGEEIDIQDFGRGIPSILQRRMRVDTGKRTPRVYFSNVGGPCVRKLWYKVNAADQAEPLRPHTRIKFLYGDILEDMLLDLARRAGHVVEREQEQVEWNGITGRIDAIIDGVLVDVKSASSYSFKKFQSGLRSEDDSFGYLEQLKGYLLVTRNFTKFTNRAAFLVINKETGKLHLDVHEFSDEELENTAEQLASRKRTAEDEATTPDRAFEAVPEGKSGNLKLGVECSYCEFKAHCWPEVRTFLYSNKPVHLVHVEREPNVPELTE